MSTDTKRRPAMFTQTTMAKVQGEKRTWFRCNGCGARIKFGGACLAEHVKKHAAGRIVSRG